MTNKAIIETIKSEKINVLSKFHHDDDSIRAIYLCTMLGTEFTLEENFLKYYEVNSKHNSKFNKSGWLEKDMEYTIVEKESGMMVHSQR